MNDFNLNTLTFFSVNILLIGAIDWIEKLFLPDDCFILDFGYINVFLSSLCRQ